MKALAMGEPWCKSLAEIDRMDRRQLVGLVFWPRDREGQLITTPKKAAKTAREAYFERWRARGLAEYRIEELWEREHGDRGGRPRGGGR